MGATSIQTKIKDGDIAAAQAATKVEALARMKKSGGHGKIRLEGINTVAGDMLSTVWTWADEPPKKLKKKPTK